MKIISRSLSQTVKIGSAIAKNLKQGDIVCLFGELGSGKTALAKGIAKGLGIKEDKVISPSFVLIRLHTQGRLPLYHFDLYRLKRPQEILGLGYEEYLYGDGVALIEWAGRLKYLLPKEFLKIELSHKARTQRVLEFTAFGAGYKELLKEIYENIRH